MDYDYLKVSNGSGDSALMHVTANRIIGSTTIKVDTISNVPDKFIATYGTLLSSGFIDPATKRDFKGHLSGADVIIDAFEPGSADAGNTAGQVVIIKPNSGWSNRVSTFIRRAMGIDATPDDFHIGQLTATGLTIGGRDLSQFMPVGALLSYAGAAVPSGWLLCDGTAVSRTTYAALYAAIGTTHGTGNGSTTFNVPDLRGRVTIGVGTATGARGATAHTLGEKGGEQTHQLSVAEIPSHDHLAPTPVGSATGPGYEMSFTSYSTYDYGGAAPVSATGGSGDHNNMQPYIGLNAIIKF